MSRIAVIGAGFSGLSAAAYLADWGHQVDVYEKNDSAGGRARQWKTDSGYIFDMGPSWYWMPDVFDRFFGDFGYNTADFYQLTLLDPAFDMVFPHRDMMQIPANFNELCVLFESIEKGSCARLQRFMEEAKFKYRKGMEELVYMPCQSVAEFARLDLLAGILRMQVFGSFGKHVRKYFSHPKLIALMEFPILFLGAMPEESPALYRLMNYAGLVLGTWYPQGGFGKVVEAIMQIARKKDAGFYFSSPVEAIIVEDGLAKAIVVNGYSIEYDAIIAAADYQHVDNELLPPSCRNYTQSYWDKRTLAPSCLIYYIGLDKKIDALQHHTLFFDEDLALHSKEIYKTPQWPTKPLFYLCCPSRTDKTVAPPGHENLFLLMPLAAGLPDSEDIREKYFKIMMDRLEGHLGQEIRSHIDFRSSYCASDFVDDYNSFKGNAYGLANTLSQTAFMKTSISNKKVRNLYYAGQLTVPGPGVPPSLISGKIAAKQLSAYLKRIAHEGVV